MLDNFDGFASADVNVLHLIKELLKNRNTIPQNIVFAGLSNTPWSSQNSLYPFTSIDFNIDELVKAVLEISKSPQEKKNNIYISPKLIERERIKKVFL